MAVNIGTLRGYLELDTSKWVSRLQQSSAALDTMAESAKTVGQNMSVYLTAPLVGVGTVATKMFIDFEGAMKGVEAALNPLPGELKQLEDAAIEWGAKTKFSATESAEALGELGKAGFNVSESIAGLPSVLQLATVAGMGLADAATLTADTLTQFNLSVDQAGRVNDVLAAGAQASTIDVQQLGESLKYAGPVAAAFGLSIEDTVGALAEFGNSGIKASMAGTALRGILTDIEVPTKGMSDTLAKLGIETLKSADGTIKLAEVIDTLKKSGASAGDIMTAFGDRAGPVMVSLVQKGSKGIRDLTADMYKAEGAAQRVSDTMMSGLGGALEEMSGAVETAGMAIGRVLAPAVTLGAQAIGGFANILTTTVVPAFQSLPNAFQAGIGGVLGLTAAAGPAIYAFAKLAEATSYLAGTRVMGFLVTAMSTLGNTIPVLTLRVWLLDAAQKAAALSAGAWSAASSTAIGTSLAAGASRVATLGAAFASLPALLAAAASAGVAWWASLNQTTNAAIATLGPLGQLIAKLTEYRAVVNSTAQNTERQADATRPLVKLMASHGEAIDRTTVPLKTMGQQLADVTRQVNALSSAQRAEIDATLKLGGSSEEAAAAANKLGGSVKVTSQIVDLYRDRLKEGTKATKDLTKATKEYQDFQKSMADSVWDTTQRLREIEKARVNDALQGIQRSRDAIVADLNTRTNAEQSAAQQIRMLTMGTLEFQLDAIKRKGEADKAALQSTGALAAETAAAIDNSTRVQTAVAIAGHEGVKNSMQGLMNVIPGLRSALELTFPGYVQQLEQAATKTDVAAQKTTSWMGNISGLAQSFSQLSQVSGGAFGSITKGIAEIIGSLDIAIEGGKKFFQTLGDPDKFKDAKFAFMDLASAIIGGVGSVASATSGMDLKQNLIGGAMSGAASGAAIAGTAAALAGATAKGAAVAGIWGAAAGVVVGIFIAVFRGQEARREMRIVGKEWGQDISEGLSEQIRKASEFGGDRVANALFRMKDIISEAGGVDPSNFDRLIAKLRDVFVMVETGTFSIAQAARVLNENFADFAAASVATGQLASAELREIIRLNAELGVNASAVIDFVSQQTTRVGAGLATIAAPITASIVTWRDEVIATQAKLDEMTEAGKVGTEEWVTAQTRLNELGVQHGELVAHSVEDLDALGVVALGTFGAALESGVSYLEAVRAIGPGIDAIIDAQKALGISSDNIAVQDLVNFRDRVRANERLVASAEALDDTLLAVSHTTGLNADSLAAMERLGMSTFQKLKDAGFSNVEALKMMGGFLENVTQAHMDLGIPIDDNIGALINLADEHGVLKTKSKDFKDVFAEGVKSLVDVINELIKALGTVPGKVNDIGSAIERVPKRVVTEWEFRVPDVPTVNPVQMHGGSNGLRDWGSDGTLAMLHNKEAVVPEDEWKAMMRGLRMPDMEGVSGGGGGRVVNQVTIDARGALLGDYESQQRLRKIMSDAFMNDYELRGQVGVVGVR